MSHYVLCALPFQESGLWIPRVRGYTGKEGPTWLPVRQTLHTHLQLPRSRGCFQRTKPIHLQGALTLFCLKINMQSFYDVNYSPRGNELRVSSFFRMGHFIAGGCLGLRVHAKNNVVSSSNLRWGAPGPREVLRYREKWRALEE